MGLMGVCVCWGGGEIYIWLKIEENYRCSLILVERSVSADGASP